MRSCVELHVIATEIAFSCNHSISKRILVAPERVSESVSESQSCVIDRSIDTYSANRWTKWCNVQYNVRHQLRLGADASEWFTPELVGIDFANLKSHGIDKVHDSRDLGTQHQRPAARQRCVRDNSTTITHGVVHTKYCRSMQPFDEEGIQDRPCKSVQSRPMWCT
jgi:hypothetical protein